MEIKNAEFITSVGTEDRINEYDLPEIAVAGRSNVGKSSFINYLCNRKHLAKVSSTCGKTRLLNFFSINNGEFHLVDLPGYGYAEVSDEEKLKWARLIESYLSASKNLVLVICLVDIRHNPTQGDKHLIQYLQYNNIPFIIVATKSDKLSKLKTNKARQNIANKFEIGRDDVLVTSALDKVGREPVLDRIEGFLNPIIEK